MASFIRYLRHWVCNILVIWGFYAYPQTMRLQNWIVFIEILNTDTHNGNRSSIEIKVNKQNAAEEVRDNFGSDASGEYGCDREMRLKQRARGIEQWIVHRAERYKGKAKRVLETHRMRWTVHFFWKQNSFSVKLHVSSVISRGPIVYICRFVCNVHVGLWCSAKKSSVGMQVHAQKQATRSRSITWVKRRWR